MRITIDTDDKGKVNIDTGDKGTDKPASFESTADIPVIDAGPAPIHELERLRSATTGGEGVSKSPSPQDREAQLPLNPLRAGAAAAYEDPANLRKKAARSEGTSAARSEETSAAQDPSIITIDGGSARIPGDKESSGAPTPEQ